MHSLLLSRVSAAVFGRAARSRSVSARLAVAARAAFAAGAALLPLLPAIYPSLAHAADPKPAFTDAAQADDDFPFVGEYWGILYSKQGSQWEYSVVGLQLAAQGDGKFQATEYLEGLPGAGWNKNEHALFPAARTGDVVNIPAEPLGMQVDGEFATVGSYGKGPVYGFLRRVVRSSPTLGKAAPSQATVLFDGTTTDQFVKANISPEGLLTQGAETQTAYSDFTLHVEFKLPYMPTARDQGRANSGVYIQRRYEVQILDSFGELPAFNTAASLYRTKPADLNMSLPPLSWQTYDIRFQAARFENGKKVADAVITVWHNGIKVQDHYAIPNKTGAGKAEGPEPFPILFQDHNNPVRFRNIWIVDHTQHPNVDATPKDWTPPKLVNPYDRSARAASSTDGYATGGYSAGNYSASNAPASRVTAVDHVPITGAVMPGAVMPGSYGPTPMTLGEPGLVRPLPPATLVPGY